MKYQLVLQLPSSSSREDYARLLSIEETIRSKLDDSGVVDGHDIGSGEMNVFVHTDEPRASLEKILSILKDRTDLLELKAGYRDFDDDEYVPVFPASLRRFTVV